MKNGIHFRNSNPANSLVLVENTEAGDGNFAEYLHTPDFHASESHFNASSQEGVPPQAAFVVFASVSIVCTVTAIATGSYAVWLSRQRSARQALTDVKDILKSCQERMQQLEADVQRMPRF